MRKFTALVAATALVTTLSACTAAGSGCEPPFTEGKASALVSADGAVGAQPEVSFPIPLFTKGTELSVLEAGDGAAIGEGQIVDVQLTLLHGPTGAKLTQSSYDPKQPIRRTAGDPADFFGQIVQCAEVGSRIAATTTVESIYGRDALASLGIGNDETLIAVVDVQRAYLARANGADRLAEPGMPAVVLSPEGVPGVTVPKRTPPTELRVATLKAGAGKIVEAGDHVVAHLTGLDWATNRVFQSTWPESSPTTLVMAGFEDDDNGIPDGLLDALVGQKVGSQVLVVMPPELGFPEGAAPDGVSDGATLVFVVDVLGIE